MLDSSKLKISPFKDKRTAKEPAFVGASGALFIGESEGGQKFLIKHTYPHNAANEYTACWLAERLGVYAPKAYLLTEDTRFASPYAVAIEYIEGFENFSKDAVPNKSDLISQFALNALIYTEDILQMNRVGNRIISYDYSESFNMGESVMRSALRGLQYDEDRTIDTLRRVLNQYRFHLSLQNFDIPGLAKEFNLEPDEMKSGMTETARRVLDISEAEITEMSDELCELYPIAIAVYYEECILAMQRHMKKF